MATNGMTKKDFVAIQTAIKDARDAILAGGMALGSVRGILDSMCKDVAKTLAKQNPKFDRVAFLKGCGCE